MTLYLNQQLVKKMDFPSSPLFRNVYQLVEKETGQTVDQNDGVDLTAVLEKDSQYAIKTVKQRLPIMAQYESFYSQMPKKPQSQNMRRRPVMKEPNANDISHLDDFLLLSNNDADSDASKILNVNRTQSSSANRTMSRLFHLKSKQKISLYDLKDNEVLSKIKQRCTSQNPNQTLFSDFQVSRNSRHMHIQSLDVGQPKPKHYPLLHKRTGVNGSLRSGMLSPTGHHHTSTQESSERALINTVLAAFERKQQFLETHKFSRDNLKTFLLKSYQVQINEMTAIEGIHYCRGKLMDKSASYSRDKLLDWLTIQIPILQTSTQIQETIAINRIRNAQKQYLTQQGEMTPWRGIENEQRSINIDEVLLAANMNSKVKSKLVNTLMELDNLVQEQQSRQGMLGQVAAQQRLFLKSQDTSKARRQEVQRQLIETCHYDSAVRSINLAKFMNPSWSETPNSYQVVSKLTNKQKRRLNEMVHKRLEFK